MSVGEAGQLAVGHSASRWSCQDSCPGMGMVWLLRPSGNNRSMHEVLGILSARVTARLHGGHALKLFVSSGTKKTKPSFLCLTFYINELDDLGQMTVLGPQFSHFEMRGRVELASKTFLQLRHSILF